MIGDNLMTEDNGCTYEALKRLYKTDLNSGKLTAAEYDEAIKRLAERLGI